METINVPVEKSRFILEDFEGPLDLLLFLIRKSEVNIYDIPIAQITEQYISFLDLATKTNLDDLTDFLLMATTLLLIKSRMLLPVEISFDDEFEDPRQELVDRLIEYQKYKKFSELMAVKEEESEWHIERNKKQAVLPFPENDDLWEKIDVWDLLSTFTTIVSSLSNERIIDLYEEVSVNEKLSLINELLESRGEFLFTDLITKVNSSMDVICAFLAILESVKARNIIILQNKLFGDIKIKSRGNKGE
ncbi:MAG: segregation/condensation protein A [Spirochaetia bacterium]|jgi:segregation and condensation protein A|nr:segregation/condensation protein A [Spirochaetia bacterium]